ncbi:MAG: hypothetical protein PVG89_10475, partial [Gammaproteobacteria bacterium]
GFKVQHCQLSQDIVAHSAGQKWSLVLVHPDTRVYAEISPATTSLDMPGYEVNFWSIAPDGNGLLTLNGRGHTVMSEIPGVTVHDPMIQSLHQQYDMHLEERREWSSTTNYQLLDPSAYVASQQKLMDGYFTNLQQERGLKKKDQHHYRLSLLKCLKMVVAFFRGELKARKLLKTRFKSKLKNKLQGTASKALSSSAYPVETDVLAYKRLSSIRERHLSGLFSRFMLVAATWVVVYFILGLSFSLNSLLILLGAVLLHELGHILAMVLFRYRDLQVFCVPLFGWARSTKNSYVAKWKQVIVYLMGPLPGLLLGMGLIIANKTAQFPLLYEAAAVLILINYLHLLPYMSLDGGRIMRLLVMERFPLSKLLFPLVSGAAFAAGAYYLGEPVFWALSMMTVASIPFGMRESAVLRAVRRLMKEQRKKNQSAKDFHSLDSNNKLARVFLALKKPRFRKLNFFMKYNLVKSLDGVVHQPNAGSPAGSLSLFTVYLIALLITPQAVLLTVQQNSQTFQLKSKYLGQLARNDLDSKIARAATSQKRFQLLTQAADEAMTKGDFSKARDYLSRAETSYQQFKENDALAELSRGYAKYYTLNRELDAAVKYQQKAIAVYEKKPSDHYFQLAASYDELSEMLFQQQNRYDSENSLTKALSYAINIDEPDQWYMITKIAGQLLDWYYLEDRQPEAQRLLSSLIDKFDSKQTPVKNYVAGFVYEELGWLHAAANDEKAAMEKFDRALELAQQYTTQLKKARPDRREETKLLLAKAAVYFKEGYNDFSKIQFNNAEELAQEGSFASIKQYIDTYKPDNLPVEVQKNYRREAKRWKLITDAYRHTHS